MFLLGAEKGAEIKLEAQPASDAETAVEQVARLFDPECPEMTLPPD